MHLRCAGRGSPAVILVPGLGDSTIVWHLVQPQIAGLTRVCAWDRAGFGFSGPSPRDQTANERAHDLELALKGAKVRGPYLLVGHSLGAYEVLVFADRHVNELAGIVLVDPAIPDQQRRLASRAPNFEAYEQQSFAAAVAGAQRCDAAVSAKAIKPGDPDPDGCFQYPDYYPDPLKRKLAALDMDPVRVRTQLSLYANDATTADGRSTEVTNPARTYRNLPLIVLSAGDPFTRSKASDAVKAEAPIAQAEWLQAHVDLARLSSRGVHRIVPDTRHDIQLMQPGAVVQAINDVLIAARDRRSRRL